VKTRYNKKLIKLVQKDRRLGLSILDLVKKYNIPKTTIWYHIKDVKLTPEVKNKILSNQGGSKKKKIEEEKRAEQNARQLLVSLNRELIVAAAMLYWAEGHKKSFVFTNSDSKMLILYIKFLKNVLLVKNNDISVLVRISDPITEEKVMSFWPKILRLPHSVFSINYDNIQNKTKTDFGICRVMVKKSSYYHKIMKSIIDLLQREFLLK